MAICCFLLEMQNKFLVSHFLRCTQVKVNTNHVLTTNSKLAQKKWTTNMQGAIAECIDQSVISQ